MKNGRSVRKYYTSDECKQIVEDYIDNNLTMKAIHRKYGCAKSSVWLWCIQLGKRKLLPFGNTQILKIKTACNFSYNQIIDYSIDRGWNFREMVKNFELNPDEERKLRLIVTEFNKIENEKSIKVPRKRRTVKKTIYKNYKDRVIELCDGTRTYIDLCNETGLSYKTLINLVAKIRNEDKISLTIKEIKRGPKPKHN